MNYFRRKLFSPKTNLHKMLFRHDKILLPKLKFDEKFSKFPIFAKKIREYVKIAWGSAPH